MGQTTFSGPMQVGPIREGAAANVGGVALSQTDTFTFADTGTTATGIILPANAQIVDIIVDVTVAWDSVTSDALEVGDGSDADKYADVADLQTAGRSTVAIDATQAAALADIGTSDVTVNVTITSAGGSLSAGAARITVLYVQGSNPNGAV